MSKNYPHLITSILFIVFAGLQLNDPDPMWWVIIYGFVALVAGLAFMGRYPLRVIALGLFCIAGYTVRYVKPFINWMQEGMPTIVGEMHAASPHIELVREFLGLIIAVVTLSVYFRLAKSRQHEKSSS